MKPNRLETLDQLVGPLYLVALLLVATPALDFITSVVPLHPGNIQWRFATVGLLSGFTLTPLLGLILAMLLAALSGHERFLRVLALLSLAAAAIFAIMLVFFLLDILQLRSAVQAESKEAFEGAAVKAVLKHIAFLVATGWLGMRAYKASRWSVAPARKTGAAVIIGN